VLHHGFAVDALVNWVHPGVVDALVQAGRQVWAIDARGHGRSEAPHDPERYGEATMAVDLRALFDVIGAERIDLVGYSMGAIVALLTATQDHRVRRLAVGGVGAGVVELGGVDTRAVAPGAIIAALQAEDPETIADPGALAFRRLADALGADRQALAAQASRRHQEPFPLSRITAPTLVLAGDADPLAVRPQVLGGAVRRPPRRRRRSALRAAHRRASRLGPRRSDVRRERASAGGWSSAAAEDWAMSISAVGIASSMQPLFDAASSNLAGAASSSSGSDSGSGGAEAIAAAQYGFDGRVLKMQANAVAQLFSALA
jgi:alpha/beta hydrolase fold